MLRRRLTQMILTLVLRRLAMPPPSDEPAMSRRPGVPQPIDADVATEKRVRWLQRALMEVVISSDENDPPPCTDSTLLTKRPYERACRAWMIRRRARAAAQARALSEPQPAEYKEVLRRLPPSRRTRIKRVFWPQWADLVGHLDASLLRQCFDAWLRFEAYDPRSLENPDPWAPLFDEEARAAMIGRRG